MLLTWLNLCRGLSNDSTCCIWSGILCENAVVVGWHVYSKGKLEVVHARPALDAFPRKNFNVASPYLTHRSVAVTAILEEETERIGPAAAQAVGQAAEFVLQPLPAWPCSAQQPALSIFGPPATSSTWAAGSPFPVATATLWAPCPTPTALQCPRTGSSGEVESMDRKTVRS